MAKTLTAIRVGILTALVLLLTLTPTALATNRYYHDSTTHSPNRKLRLEAKSPDNAASNHAPFAANFVYTLYEADANRILWTRKQGEREGSPIRTYVHDEKWVVVWTGHHQLLVLNPRGQIAFDLNILREGLPAEEVKENVVKSTAGPLWAGYSLWYFFAVEGKPHFGIRTWWDRRILVSLEAAKQVADEGAIRKAAEKSERHLVLTTLQEAAQVAKKWAAKKLPEYTHLDDGPWKGIDDLSSAIFLAARMSIKEAIPLLRDLEPIPDFGSAGGGYYDDIPDGEFLIGSHGYWDGTRQGVQLSLRRLGAKPAGYPPRQMALKAKDSFPGTPYVPKKHGTPRAARAPSIAKNMKPNEVIDSIGAPDYIFFPRVGKLDYDPEWEYDIDADSPYTLQFSGERTGLLLWNESCRPGGMTATNGIDESDKKLVSTNRP